MIERSQTNDAKVQPLLVEAPLASGQTQQLLHGWAQPIYVIDNCFIILKQF